MPKSCLHGTIAIRRILEIGEASLKLRWIVIVQRERALLSKECGHGRAHPAQSVDISIGTGTGTGTSTSTNVPEDFLRSQNGAI